MHAHAGRHRFSRWQAADIRCRALGYVVFIEQIPRTESVASTPTESGLGRVQNISWKISVECWISVCRGAENIAISIKSKAPRVVIELVKKLKSRTIRLETENT